MKFALLLSKEDIHLGKEEALAILSPKSYSNVGNLLIMHLKEKEGLFNRLAYTDAVYVLLFESSYNQFIGEMERFDWKSVYRENFCVRVSSILSNSIKSGNKHRKVHKNIKFDKKLYSEQNLAGFIWRGIDNPKVTLRNSKTNIRIFFTKNKVYCCLLHNELRHDFNSRKSHKRPRPSPVSLHPKLAKAMVNLTGAKNEDTVVDPFCGSGGILIEAGLMGLRVVGYDLNKKMLWKSIVNLKHFGIKSSSLLVKDFFNIRRKYKYIVTDLPYGLNTNIMQNIRVTKVNKNKIGNYLDKFYGKIISHLENILADKAVVIFPNYFDYRKALKKSKLKIKHEFERYVHNNLTRKIVVLEK
jgi:tRNA (guanine10-N2)-dimethyltransferase